MLSWYALLFFLLGALRAWLKDLTCCVSGYYLDDSPDTVARITVGNLPCILCPDGADCGDIGVRFTTLKTARGNP